MFNSNLNKQRTQENLNPFYGLGIAFITIIFIFYKGELVRTYYYSIICPLREYANLLIS